MILDGLFRRPRERRADPVNVTTLESVGMQNIVMGGETAAMKLAAVNRCLEVISDSVGKMPSYGMITSTRERVFPPVLDLLNLRPNEAMTPFIRRKMLELNRLIRGFAVEWILRDPITMEPVELIPVPSELVNFWQDTAGHVWYDITHPYNGAVMRLASTDVLHYKGYTRDGLHSLSVLQRASQVIGAGLDAQAYQGRYYSSGGQPSGVLSTEADLGGYVKDKAGKPTDVTRKDALRREWDRIHSGPDNAYRVAILDHGVIAEQGTVEEIFSHPQTEIGRSLVYPNGVQIDRLPPANVIRIAFNGGSSYEPLIASLAIDCGVKVNILGADTRNIEGKAFGTMLLGLPEDSVEAAKALRYIQSQPDITVEEVTGHV